MKKLKLLAFLEKLVTKVIQRGDGQQITKTTSKFLQLNLHDLLRGAVIAAISPVFTILINSVANKTVTIDWSNIAKVAMIAGLTYLSKNFFSRAVTIVTITPPIDKEKGTETIKT